MSKEYNTICLKLVYKRMRKLQPFLGEHAFLRVESTPHRLTVELLFTKFNLSFRGNPESVIHLAST